MTPRCNWEGCPHDAAGALGIELYPYSALMKHYRRFTPLTRFLVGLNVCPDHAKAVDPVTFLGAGILPIVKLIERSSGVSVDMAGSKAVVVPFSDPDYQALIAQRAPRQDIEGRETAPLASPGGGPTGVGQAAAAAPTGEGTAA